MDKITVYGNKGKVRFYSGQMIDINGTWWAVGEIEDGEEKSMKLYMSEIDNEHYKKEGK